MTRFPLLLFLIAMPLVLVGCTALTVGSLPVIGGEGGEVRLESQFFDEQSLGGGFEHCVYRFDSDNDYTVLMYDGPIESPTRAAVIRSFWRPTASRTPIDSDATNATLQYYAFTRAGDGTPLVGVYTGAGYVYTSSKPGSSKVRASIWQATVRLVDRSAEYDDPLGEAMVTGETVAIRDDEAMPQLLHTLHVQVNERLGYPRL